jgi:hypothetical protein
MIRNTIAALAVVFLVTSFAEAQVPRFGWRTGQVLVYKAEHQTLASYLMGDSKSETRTRVLTTKRWQVVNVDATGEATLQLSLQALVFETTRPDGEKLSYDSAHPEKSTEQMRKQFASYVGQPLALVRIDGQGKVIEVKEPKTGYASAARYESDPPFKLVLPADILKAGQGWERNYQIILEPPQGTGEKYLAVQHYVCKGIADNLATVALTTEVKVTPAALEDQVPLWQMQPEGEIVFDVRAGRLQKATLRIDKEAKGAGGEGSTHFQSSYTEEYIGDR